QAKTPRATAQFTIKWSSATKAPAVRKPLFISPSAQSIRVDTAPAGSTDLSQRVTTIVNNTGTSTSTVGIDAPIGNDTFTFTVFDQANAQGTNLGGGMVTQTIAAGTANVVKATLDGYLAGLAISSNDTRLVKTSGFAGGLPIYAIVGTSPITFTVAPLDADGNVILSGAPTITAQSDSSAFSLAPVAGSSTSFTIQAVGPMPAGVAARMTFSAPSATRTFSATYTLMQLGLLYATGGTGTSAHVFAFDTTGKQYTLSGSFPGLQTPIGIAFDNVNQRLYVADSGASSILAYDMNGNAATGWTPPSVPQPTGIAYSASANHVLVTSKAGTGAVLVFDKSGAPVANPGFTGLHGLPVGIADGATDSLIAVVDAGNPGYLDVFTTAGAALTANSSSLVDGNNLPFSPAGVGAADGNASLSDRFWVSGTDASNGPETALYWPITPNAPLFFYAALYFAGEIWTPRVTGPTTSAYNIATNEFYIVDSGQLRGFSCAQSPCDGGYPPSLRPPEAALIAPPNGITFTAAAFAHY
ncbi:MAG TPA: hypothetical protein VJP85_09190, partial [Candidatus Baltobacteraceae bacterium]|nr:hypothetical protein [Candidatus Baltobacteraceae bacterium]